MPRPGDRRRGVGRHRRLLASRSAPSRPTRSTTSTSSSPTATPTATRGAPGRPAAVARSPRSRNGAVVILPDATPLGARRTRRRCRSRWVLDDYLALLAGRRRARASDRTRDADTDRRPAGARPVRRRAPAHGCSSSPASRSCVARRCVLSIAFGSRGRLARRRSLAAARPATDRHSAAGRRRRARPAHRARGCSSAPRWRCPARSMQGVTRNPLADPGILGVNVRRLARGRDRHRRPSDSSDLARYIWLAIAGAAVAAVFVYAVGSLGRGGATPLKLALAGAATSAALASLISAIMLPRVDIMNDVPVLADRRRRRRDAATAIAQVLPFLVVGALICLAVRARAELARARRRPRRRPRRARRPHPAASPPLGAVMLCGAATAIAGPIALRRTGRPAHLPAARRHRPPLAAAVLDVLGAVPARSPPTSSAASSPGRRRSTSASSPRSSGRPSSSAIVRRQKVREL